MADEKNQAVDVEDIDGPIEIKQTQGAHNQRVGVSKNGLVIAGVLGLAVVGLVGIGIINAGPSSDSISSKASSSTTDMPGQNPAISVAKMAAEAEAKRQAETPAAADGLQVRGGESSPNQVGTAPQQQSPRELHVAWLEKKRYERIQGRILAADLALTAEMSKGSGGGLIRPSASVPAKPDEVSNPLARLAGIRNAAHNSVLAGQAPTMLAAPGAAVVNPAGMLAASSDPNVAAQMRNREFLKEAAEAGYLPERVKPKMGQHELAAGSIIPAVMLTGINSELPGVITAQVRQSVYDTFDENALVVPQGSRIVGRYSSQVAYGQERVLVAWDEMILPNGNRINLRGMAGADGLGQAGLNDQVDTHFWRVWGSSLMVSMLGVGVQLSQPQNSSVNNSPTASQQAAGAAANSMNQTGSKVLEKNMNTAPTLTIRPGYAFNVIVNKSINFPAYLD